jgi:hypothetical protein
VRDLGRKDLAPQEKAELQLELDTVEPLVDRDLVRRSALRYGNVIDEALTPEDRYYGADTPTIERMRRIDRIKPDSEQPGMNYLRHGRELIPVADQTLQAIRANAMGQLNKLQGGISQANEEVASDYGDLMYRSFKKHPVVGFISSIRSGEHPADWQETLMSFLATSNMQLREFDRMRTASQDPWNTAPSSLEEMARKVDAGLRMGEGARNYLDYKTDQLYEGTRGAIRHLGRMKTAGQVAASLAFSPLAGAAFAAGGSILEQSSEIYYGQREHFDPLAVGIDAGAALAGGLVTNRLMGVVGKNAPLWLRTAAFVSADRAGAAATTITHGAIDWGLNRSDKGFSEIMGDAASDLTDWKQAGINLFTLGLGHAARSGRGGGRGQRGTKAPPPETVAPLAAPVQEAGAAPSLSAPVPAHGKVLLPPSRRTVRATKENAPAAATSQPALDLEKRGYQPAPGERTTTRAQWKAQQGARRWKKAVDAAFERLDTLDPADAAQVARVQGGQSKPRIEGKAVPGRPRTKMDMNTVPRRAGETGRQAVARVRTVIGTRLSDHPFLEKLWNGAKADVLAKKSLTQSNYGKLYERTRNAFWRKVRGNTPEGAQARQLLNDAGFELPSGIRQRGTAPALAGVDPSIPKAERLISLDHVAEKGQGTGWQKALDADTLRMEFAMPNTEREIKQMRHPELREP